MSLPKKFYSGTSRMGDAVKNLMTLDEFVLADN
jgi:hypothetical protein